MHNLQEKISLLISLTSVPGALFSIFLVIILTLGLVAELNQILWEDQSIHIK
jgi:hypothetical protein